MAEEQLSDAKTTPTAKPSAAAVKLFQFHPALGLPNASPFCVKLETWLRIANVPYENVYTPDPRKAPMGKLPMIEVDGKTVADSTCAIEHLEKVRGKNLNKQMNTVERGRALALIRMLEEHSYWALIYFRWLDDEGFAQTRETFFGRMNSLSKGIVSSLVRRKTRRDALGQGLARHSRDQILHRFNEDMNALASNLGERPYFGGYQPANIDAAAYALLCNVLHSTTRCPLSDVAEQHANLVAYTDRMRDSFFPEYR